MAGFLPFVSAAAELVEPHLAQALHPLQAPQLPPQLPPQELLPAFLSRTMPRIKKPTTRTMTAIRTMLMRLADKH